MTSPGEDVVVSKGLCGVLAMGQKDATPTGTAVFFFLPIIRFFCVPFFDP